MSMTVGEGNRKVRHLTFDSRDINENDLFIAIKGFTTDGHLFISKAIDKGAIAVVCEDLPKDLKEE